MKNVLIPTKLDKVARELLTQQGYKVIQDASTPLAKLVVKYLDTNIMIVRSEKVDSAIIDSLPELKVIVRAGAGYNTIDTKYARKHSIDVMNTPGANSNAVAEEVIALVLAAYRHIIPADKSTREGLWEKKNFMGKELTGKTFGIVGLGNIGQILSKRLAGFDMNIIAYDPIISEDKAGELGVELVDMKTLFEKADIVSLHIPATKDTIGLIDKSYLSTMKNGAVVINCARSQVMNEDDLRSIKKEKNIIFCNDVYEKDCSGEKSVADFADIMLPHLGASTEEANFNAAKRAAEQIIALQEQGVTRYVVNKQIPDGLDEKYQELAHNVTAIARHYLGKNMPVHSIACSFYGDLNKFSRWFIAPIVAGICPEFSQDEDYHDAEEFLNKMGVSYATRETDDTKKYGNSMTIDLLQGEKTLQKVSVRGTISEGKILISRINNFDNLYFRPNGNNLIVSYEDRPGVLSAITGACANAGLNIIDIRAPQEQDATHALTIVKTDKPVTGMALEQVKMIIKPDVAFAITI